MIHNLLVGIINALGISSLIGFILLQIPRWADFKFDDWKSLVLLIASLVWLGIKAYWFVSDKQQEKTMNKLEAEEKQLRNKMLRARMDDFDENQISGI